MVEREGEHAFVVAQPHEARAQHRIDREIEVAPRETMHECFVVFRVRGTVAQIEELQCERFVGRHDLLRQPVLQNEPGTQHFVTGDESIERRAQGIDIERPAGCGIPGRCCIAPEPD